MRRFFSIDLELAAIADEEWGIVTRERLLALGLSASAIDRMIRSGRLRVLHRGVYAVGHTQLRPQGHRLAAVLACGRGAVLSHAAAAAHRGLRPSAATAYDVIVPTGNHRRRPGIRIHRHATLLATEATVYERVPVTTVARTALDLAATFPRRTIERVLDQAEVLGVFDLAALDDVVAAHRGRPGAPLLAAVIAEYGAGEGITRSELEDAFLSLCDAHGIPRPRVNSIVAGLEVDFFWPRRRLVVEVDGWAFHRGRRAFERDRERDAVLASAGLHVLRFTHRQLIHDAALVAAATARSAQPRSMSSTR